MPEWALIDRIERAALRAWPPRETARDDGWLLRADGGGTRRVNSVQTLVFAADSDLDRTVARVESWYAFRGLPACFQLTDRSAPARLDAMLGARGYRRSRSFCSIQPGSKRTRPRGSNSRPGQRRRS